jgi:hypothetical protein
MLLRRLQVRLPPALSVSLLCSLAALVVFRPTADGDQTHPPPPLNDHEPHRPTPDQPIRQQNDELLDLIEKTKKALEKGKKGSGGGA